MKNIPYSKYKTLLVSGNLELTSDEMKQYKTSSENTHNMDWDRLVPDEGSTLVKNMRFKQSDMEVIIEDARKIAKECPFLDMKVDFSHDYFNDELGDFAEDQPICSLYFKDGQVTVS